MAIVDPRTGAPLSSAPAAQGAPDRQPNVDDAQLIVDIDMQNFQQVVLEGSMHTPVLLDCWASWCEPCKNLTPILEKLAREYRGAFILAKLDIEANPQIAAQLGIRSVPDVKLIHQGQLYDQFQGALPESKIREWLSQYIEAPAPAEDALDELAAQALAEGDIATARALYHQLIEAEPEQFEHRIGYAEVLAAEGETVQAAELLDTLPVELRDSARAKGLQARLGFAAEAPSQEEIAQLAERDDSEARFKRAFRAIADGRYEEGLEGLLALMKSDRQYGEDAARKTLLRVFEALGGDHPLTVGYRRKLFALLY